MAHHPQDRAPEPEYDPAGNTQMFRAFVDEGPSQGARPAAAGASSRVGLIVGVVVALAVLAVLVWIAVG